MTPSPWPGPGVDLAHGPLRVSDNGRFLQHADGTPFFWMGDTGWEIFHRLTRGEAEFYLETRRSQGFNLIQAVALAEFEGLRVPNIYGQVPFHDLDPSQPNEPYWQHVDWVIDCAAKKGMLIGLLPTWGDKVVHNAWGAGPLIFNADNMRAYGEWLGRRYGNRNNIVWITGGDRPVIWQGRDSAGNPTSTSYLAVWQALSAGLDAGAGKHILTTYHPAGGRANRTSLFLHQEKWLDLNMMQSGHGEGQDTPVWDYIREDYALTPTKPTLDGEPNYEDHPVRPWPTWDPQTDYYRDHDVRKQIYRSVFAGGCGVTYGHHAMWQFYDPARDEPVNFPDRHWHQAIVRPAANQVLHLRRLIESLPYFTRIPDDGIIARGQTDHPASHLTATRDSESRYALIYIPNTQTITVRMDCIKGSHASASWYDPRTGTTSPIGHFAPTGTRTFCTPDHGPDWVLVLKAAA